MVMAIAAATTAPTRLVAVRRAFMRSPGSRPLNSTPAPRNDKPPALMRSGAVSGWDPGSAPQTSTDYEEPVVSAQVSRLAAVLAAYGCGSAPELDRLPLLRHV